MQQIGVDREGRVAALVLGDRDLVLLGEVDQRIVAQPDDRLAGPTEDLGELWLKGLDEPERAYRAPKESTVMLTLLACRAIRVSGSARAHAT